MADAATTPSRPADSGAAPPPPPFRPDTRLELRELRVTPTREGGRAVKKIKVKKVEKILATATAIEY